MPPGAAGAMRAALSGEAVRPLCQAVAQAAAGPWPGARAGGSAPGWCSPAAQEPGSGQGADDPVVIRELRLAFDLAGPHRRYHWRTR